MGTNLNFGLRRLDRYVLGEVMRPWLGLCVFFYFTLLLFQALRLSDFLIVHHAPPFVVLQIVGLMLISFTPVVVPLAFFGAVMMGFGRLSSESELVAMKASGISLRQMARPVIWASIPITLFAVVMSLKVVPWSDLNMTRKLFMAGNIQVVHAIQPRTFNAEFFGLMIYADDVDMESGVLRNVFIHDERDQKNPMVVVAPLGLLSESRAKDGLSRKTLLELKNGSMHRQQRGNEPFDQMSFETYRLFLQSEAGRSPEPSNTRVLQVEQLWERILTAPSGDRAGHEASVELSKRLALATTPLIFVFLGAGLGCIRGRTVASRSTLLTFLVAVLYWQALVLSVAWANSVNFPAPLILMLPNLALAVLAVWSFRRASW